MIAPMLKMTMVPLFTRTLLAAPASARHCPAQHPSAATRAILAAHPQAHKMRSAARGPAPPTPYSLPQVGPECCAYGATSVYKYGRFVWRGANGRVRTDRGRKC